MGKRNARNGHSVAGRSGAGHGRGKGARHLKLELGESGAAARLALGHVDQVDEESDLQITYAA